MCVRSKAAVFFLLSLFLLQIPVFAADPQFSVSPGEFTVRDVPPAGNPSVIGKKIVLRNHENISRVVSFSVDVPSPAEVTPGYEPIPSENWVTPFPSSIEVEENSSAEIQISLNIPRWENLTGKKWEIWILVEKQPILPEVFPVVLTAKMRIETTEDLPPINDGAMDLPYFLIGGIAAVVAVIIVVFLLVFRKKGEKGTRWELLSESMKKNF